MSLSLLQFVPSTALRPMIRFRALLAGSSPIASRVGFLRGGSPVAALVSSSFCNEKRFRGPGVMAHDFVLALRRQRKALYEYQAS